ncbi:mitochondrial protein Pet127-domain-containing protein [Dipodascopsis uninucleata]
MTTIMQLGVRHWKFWSWKHTCNNNSGVLYRYDSGSGLLAVRHSTAGIHVKAKSRSIYDRKNQPNGIERKDSSSSPPLISRNQQLSPNRGKPAFKDGRKKKTKIPESLLEHQDPMDILEDRLANQKADPLEYTDSYDAYFGQINHSFSRPLRLNKEENDSVSPSLTDVYLRARQMTTQIFNPIRKYPRMPISREYSNALYGMLEICLDKAIHKIERSSKRVPWDLQYDFDDNNVAFSDSAVASNSVLEIEDTVDFSSLELQAIEQPGDDELAEPPVLEHGLDRVLFNPGVHFLQDPRSRVYNFSPKVKHIMSVHDFDYDALPEYQTSSQDTVLKEVARTHQKKYYSSTSNMTSALSHLHFLLSKWRKLTALNLSLYFKDSECDYTSAAVMPASFFLRYKPETQTYAIDNDRSDDHEIILTYLGRSMEKQLVTTPEEYENYRIGKSQNLDPALRLEREAYHYTACAGFLMRSQQDCMDPRLPGTGTFDLKTRAVAAVRYDIDQIHRVGSTGYQIKSLYGEFESFESEYRDMIRAAFLKYSMQVRIGRMDGIFVAYHNIARIFGFQYIPLEEMDFCIHGPNHRQIADREFVASCDIFTKFLDFITAKHPKKSMRIIFHTPPKVYQMNAFVEVMDDAVIEKLQNQARDKGFKLLSNVPKDLIAKAVEQDAVREDFSSDEPVAAHTSEMEHTTSHTTDSKRPMATIDENFNLKFDSLDYTGLFNKNSESGALEAEDRKSALKVEHYEFSVHNIINGEKIPNSVAPEPKISDNWSLEYEISSIFMPMYSQKLYREALEARSVFKGDRDMPSETKLIKKLRAIASSGSKYEREMDNRDSRKPAEVYSPNRLREILARRYK